MLFINCGYMFEKLDRVLSQENREADRSRNGEKMTKKIPADKWRKFFDEASKRRFDWLVDVEIINEEIGDQILDRGLPLVGITADDRRENVVIEIAVGEKTGQHQTHSIINPQEVAYLSNKDDAGGTVEILENDGTKTLIHFLRPMPLALDYTKEKKIAAA